MERLARRAGLAWRRGETLDELGRRLEARYPGSGAAGAAALLEQLAYSEPGAASPRDPSPEQERAVRASLRSLARSTRLGARLRAGRRPGSARR